MQDLCTGHAAWSRDAHRVIDVAGIASYGLPIPTIDPNRATFRFTATTHAEASRQAIADALAAINREFDVARVAERTEQAGSTRRILFDAILRSGYVLTLVARAEHFNGAALASAA